MPLYNKEKEVDKAVKSVLTQTFSSFELIVVNDESIDNSVSIVSSINDPRIHIISQKNKGEFGARNTGIKLAKADYISFLDADDEWKPTYLETIYQLVKKFPEAGLYCTSRQYQLSATTITGKYTRGFSEGEIGIIASPFRAFALDRMAPMSCSSTTVPKHVFQELGLFFEKRGGSGDWHMWTRIMIQYPVAYAAEMLVLVHSEAENRLSCIPSNMQLKKSYVLDVFESNSDVVKKYINEYKEDVNLFMDFINISLASAWIATGGNGKTIREILCRVENKKVYRIEIIYYTIQSFVPVALRNSVAVIMRCIKKFVRK